MIMEYDQKTISESIHTEWAGKTVHFAKETDSTNEWIKKLSKEGAPEGTLAVAEFQSAGKGRLGRSWQAPEGSSVMMSILLRPIFEPQYASMLTLVMGLSVAEAVRDTGVKVSIKWPNDVVVSHKKICGILTEMGLEKGRIREVVIGLIAKIMEKFEKNYEKFIQTCDLSMMVEEYNDMLANRQQPVRILDKLHPYEGTALGINEQGELLVRDREGTLQVVRSGEVSVRGLYSYV